MFTAHNERFTFSLSSVLLSGNAIHCVCKYHLALCITLWKLELEEPAKEKANSLAIVIAVSSKVLCLVTRLTELQTNLLV